ncbi:39S ribosomal protein L16, mitochondrial [Dirofilaria immitis]|nr:39S ribosomal protein L16, mitochondrial [Dirofilaria immitis]
MSIHGSPLILRVAIDAVRGNKYSARADSLHVLPVFCDSYVRLEFVHAILTDDSVIIVLKMLIQRVEKSIWQNSIRFLRNNKKWIPGPEPETFENVVFPPNGEYKLPAMPEEPTYDPALGEQKFKTSKQLVSIRGFEEIHTTLIHKQYGLVAVTGGFISAYDFNFIRERLNRNLLKDQFAIWRVPAPWLPRTKKATGAKPGSGKGNIHHYVTPVRAKRIILEVGGYIMELEARAYLMYLCERFRFPVEFVSEKILKEKELQEKKIEELNVNKFNWDLALKYNMQNCRKCNGSQMALVGEEELLHCSFRWFITISASLPVSALFLCISLALTLHFDESTETHCDVTNYLPSISAAIASYSPERYIWRFLIALQSAPRIVIALAFRNFLLTSPLRPLNDRAWFGLACQIACVINVAESLFLLLLTTVSSSENHAVHTTSFTGFAVCSIIYMLISTALFQYSGRRRTSSLGEKSFQYKVLMCSISVLSLLIAIYFFNRHNTFCEPGIYTLFAVSEYVVVLSNILFHYTVVFDFHGKYFILTSSDSIIVMVFFSCDKCGEALKKNQVDKHGFKCRNTTYSCLDCGQAFSLETYKNHIKCVTENKKYGGKNYVEKENKGEAKQNRWIEQVERAIENVTDKELKDLLQQIRGFNNIPRKEAKFINFCRIPLKSGTEIYALRMQAWNCISEQARKMQQEAEKIESKKAMEKTLRMDDEKKFKWKRTIKRALKEAEDGQMKIKRLKAKVIQSYLASGQSNGNDENPEIIFNAKLYSLEGEIKNMEVAVSAEVAWCPNTYDEPISSSLFGLCIRYFALQHDEIKDLPQFIAQRIQILQYDMDIARRMYEGHVTFKLSWIFVGKDGYMDWPKTYAKCFHEMPADEFFIFAAINGIATKAFGNGWMNRRSKYKSIVLTAYHGWPGALCAWIGIRNNHLNNVNYQEELVGDNLELSRLETSTASSLNYTEFAILLAIRNGQYHMLRYLPTISLNEYLESIAQALLTWMSNFEVQRLLREVEKNGDVKTGNCIKRILNKNDT